MIARLLISPSLDEIKGEIIKILVSHIPSGKVDHPDVAYFPAGEKLGIEQARMIKKHLSLKPYSAKGRAVILEDASKLTPEAQNALLKTLEEPPVDALLILGASSDAKFLATVLSRLKIIHISGLPKTDPVDHQDVEKLLTLTVEERFEYIEKLKDKEKLLKSIIHYFHQNLTSYWEKGHTDFLKELLQAEEWAEQNVNIRAILEYLMLVMPKQMW